jgi:hypothetical protein
MVATAAAEIRSARRVAGSTQASRSVSASSAASPRKPEQDFARHHRLAPGGPHQLDPTGVQERPQPAVEKQQHEKPAVDAVGVGIGEHEHPLVPRSVRLAVGLEAGSDRRRERPEERMVEQLLPRGPRGIQRLALHRQHRLQAGIPHPGDRRGRGIPLDHEQLGPRTGPRRAAVGEFGNRSGPDGGVRHRRLLRLRPGHRPSSPWIGNLQAIWWPAGVEMFLDGPEAGSGPEDGARSSRAALRAAQQLEHDCGSVIGRTILPQPRAVLPAWIAAKRPAAPAPTTTSRTIVGEQAGGSEGWCIRVTQRGLEHDRRGRRRLLCRRGGRV